MSASDDRRRLRTRERRNAKRRVSPKHRAIVGIPEAVEREPAARFVRPTHFLIEPSELIWRDDAGRRLHEQLVEQREHRRVDADAEPQCQHDGRRETRRPRETAPGVRGVLSNVIEPAQQRHATHLFAIVGGVSEKSPRFDLAFGVRAPVALRDSDSSSTWKRKLAFDLARVRFAAEEDVKSMPESVDERHVRSGLAHHARDRCSDAIVVRDFLFELARPVRVIV